MKILKPILFALCFLAMSCSANSNDAANIFEENMELKISIGDTTFTAAFEDNSSAKAFAEFLKQGPMTLEMHDFGNFEKSAELPKHFPQNDSEINADAGDIILYQGRIITIYYDKNSWDLTRLAKIKNVNKMELQKILGKSKVTAKFFVE